MKTSLIFPLLFLVSVSTARAFYWPGGMMSVPVTATGHEEFAGWVPSSPWGTGNWTTDPVVQLVDAGSNVVGQYTLSGGAADWFDGGSRSGTAVFWAPAGSYSLTGVRGRKHQLITGDGYSGYSLTFESIAAPTPPNSAPVAAMTGSTSLQVGETGTWTFSASDPDGNLSAWRFRASTNPGAGWSGISGGGAGPASYSTSFSSPGTYTWILEVQDDGGLGSSASVTIEVTAPPPPNVAPTIAWNGAPGSVASGQGYTISAHGHDPDGNLVAVSVWKNGAPFAFGGGGDGTDADSGNATSDTGPQVITFTARASDGNGETSDVISQTVTVAAPPSVAASIAASPTTGMEPLATTISWTAANASAVTVSGPGVNTGAPSGSQLVTGLSAGSHTWTIAAQGYGGPVVRSATVTVSAPSMFVLTTATSGGGSVTPGGTYPAGTVVTLSARPTATTRFMDWSGDAGGSSPNVAITLDRAKFAQANFAPKDPQTLDFPAPGDHAVASGPFTLSAAASSGLPVSFAVVSGPATLAGGSVQLTGPGPVTIQAMQPGDSFYLPATPVEQTFNATTGAGIKYRPAARTLVEAGNARTLPPLVIEKP